MTSRRVHGVPAHRTRALDGNPCARARSSLCRPRSLASEDGRDRHRPRDRRPLRRRRARPQRRRRRPLVPVPMVDDHERRVSARLAATSGAHCCATRSSTRSPPPALIAYVDGEAAGWVRVGPRTAQMRIGRTRDIAANTPEPLDDPDVWAVSCFVVRREHRGQGLNATPARRGRRLRPRPRRPAGRGVPGRHAGRQEARERAVPRHPVGLRGCRLPRGRAPEARSRDRLPRAGRRRMR